jgi:hypothetical protein
MANPPIIDTTLPPEQELSIIQMRPEIDRMTEKEAKDWLMKHIYITRLLTHICKQLLKGKTN